MTYPTREDMEGRTITVTDDERRLLLRMLDNEWGYHDNDRDKSDRQLRLMSDIETLQGKLR